MSEAQRDTTTGIGLGTGPLPLPPKIPKKGWFRSNFDASSGKSIINIIAIVLSITLLSIFFLAYTTQDKQEPPEFPLQQGSSSDIHTYPNGDYITTPFVSLNNTILAIDYPEGVLFLHGDPVNNNTYVPVQSPIDPICSTGQFYSESGKCLGSQDKCPENASRDATGLCSMPPKCPVDFKYDIPSRLCVPDTWPVDCNSPNATHLNQEGWGWTIPPDDTITISDRTNNDSSFTTKANSIGFVVQWMMPNGTITGKKAGVYYNPVNFFQNVPGDTNQKYMFYQVDYGIGKILGNRQGWAMTFEMGGTGVYPFIQLKEVPVIPGSKYWIAGVLEPAPLANPPSYVVQIVQGKHSWIYKTDIDGIQPRTTPVYKFLSFQDQWISTNFTSDLTRDEISYPVIVSVENENKISLGSFLTSATPYSTLVRQSITGSYKLLSPHLTTHLTTPLPSYLNTYTDSRDCQGFGKPSNDTDEMPELQPSESDKKGKVTSVPIPVIHHSVP